MSTTVKENQEQKISYQQASQFTKHKPTSSIETTPGELHVIRRNGSITVYNEDKIRIAMTKAFLAVEGNNAAASNRVHETVELLTRKISEEFNQNKPISGVIHIEEIQNKVAFSLMRHGEYEVACAFILYREDRRKQRELQTTQQETQNTSIRVLHPGGILKPLDTIRMQVVIAEACENLTDVEPQVIFEDTVRNLYDGISSEDLRRALILGARSLVEKEPNHSYVAARLLLDLLRSEALSYLEIATEATQHEMNALYAKAFPIYIRRGIELGRLDPELAQFDINALADALNAKRDHQFTYLGLQTLYDRYFLHADGTRFELPQIFFMRIAMGLALNEPEREARAIEFYELLSSFDFMSSTPTLFNAGTTKPQLSSCFLTTVPDDLDGIYGAIKDNALLSKFAGGLGNDWTSVRAINAHIKGTNGKSQGVVPFLKVANDTAVAVNQGGKRKGAVCAYLESWHLDVEEFLELRKNTGDDRRRTHDMNTANWIPDLLMARVAANQDWTLFSPDETPELHDLYGDAFEATYIAYEEKAKRGEIRNFKTMPAVKLWRKMLTVLFETGHPWITFKDACNLRSPQQHTGVIHSSNLCTEITLNTSIEEIAVCNLGSINLVNHIIDHKINLEKLSKTIRTAVRMLDNVIDINYYTVPQAKRSNLKHRPVGLGIMGFQDALYMMRLPYASKEAVEFADCSMEAISYYAISASCELAKERGSYETYAGSLWSQGILPIDSIEILRKTRNQDHLLQNTSQTMDWESLRKSVLQHGMRNSNVMAIAPTATISNICGVSQSIEPTYQNLYVKSNLSGDFTVINPYLVQDLKKINLWDQVMVHDLKYYDGSIKKIDRIPDELKALYATAFEVEPMWLVDAASRRQKWIDQAQSLNLYMAEPSGKKLDQLYRHAWLMGLKTTYYLRSLGATNAEKSTVSDGALNAVKAVVHVAIQEEVPQACSITDPDCEACQ